MAGSRAILAIDQGTTSTRAIVFDETGQAVASAQEELPQIYPQDAWVEHDAEAIWQAAVTVCRAALAEAESGGYEVVAAGITNQRETTVVWERTTARPIHNAIVWQDRRTAPVCRRMSDEGHASLIQARTGLLLDSYFSATKVAWLLDNVSGARAAAERGELAFGTIDSYLLWRLTGGASHATDATNASRTMLFNIHEQAWDRDLLKLFNVPAVLLPAVLDNTADFGISQVDVLGKAIPITGMAGDQQAATVGQACFSPGMVKSTYGTGCFVVLNTGGEAVSSKNKLLTTVAYRLNGEPTYAIEGSIFVAGAAVQWLRDNLKLIASAGDTEALASGLDGNRGVYLVPAFTGLGAPHWDPDARGAIFGLTRDTGIAEIARATLESVCYQTRDLVVAMADDAGTPLASLRVDGGMVANDWLLSFLADLIETPVERPTVIETTALGAAYLAGLQAGVFESIDDIAARWRRDAEFRPTMGEVERTRLVHGWDKAVARVRAAH